MMETKKEGKTIRIRHEVEREDTPAVRGMVAKVGYLLEIVEGSS